MRHAPDNRQAGVTLLEVLIAVLVLSIGLLGLAGLQTTSLKASHSAYLSSQATALAYDMADRIRANAGANYGGNEPTCPGNIAATPVMQNDLDEWSCLLAALLPAGAGEILNEGTDGFRVRVSWNDPHSIDDPPARLVTELRLRR